MDSSQHGANNWEVRRRVKTRKFELAVPTQRALFLSPVHLRTNRFTTITMGLRARPAYSKLRCFKTAGRAHPACPQLRHFNMTGQDSHGEVRSSHESCRCRATAACNEQSKLKCQMALALKFEHSGLGDPIPSSSPESQIPALLTPSDALRMHLQHLHQLNQLIPSRAAEHDIGSGCSQARYQRLLHSTHRAHASTAPSEELCSHVTVELSSTISNIIELVAIGHIIQLYAKSNIRRGTTATCVIAFIHAKTTFSIIGREGWTTKPHSQAVCSVRQGIRHKALDNDDNFHDTFTLGSAPSRASLSIHSPSSYTPTRPSPTTPRLAHPALDSTYTIAASSLLEETGMRVNVVRVGQLAGDSVVGEWNEKEWVPVLLHSSQVLKAVPMRDEAISWMPVDVTADTLTAHVD
ncbi:hypothetical protein EW146_g3583 [Bondarzewia mesenterica]|uniref:Thioester reductase (TE) domain-containing protein n=1 Tax=Bondarzewia mesenterica TaxID=1095465 RepID=A0A4S4LX36_9AGAM|nr:hypothetical protein EW146_g3583 [Bondarzewia mesenterica]